MRLLNVETFRFEDFFYVSQPPPYAILSHTWGQDNEEVSYRDILAGRLDGAETRPAKVSGCCRQAKKDGYRYVWIDSCCIDKTNSVELQEAINSMFRWYQRAGVCYVFLSDVPGGDDDNPHQNPGSAFFSSRWFQRGWTLQELLAPAVVRFYGADWCPLGAKGDLCDAIEKITGIPGPFLLGITDLRHASVAQRMSWAAGRKTKRKEDIAYCLLGLFGVNMPMIYGEGSNAFRRLQEHIMKDIGDDSILAWGLDLGGQITNTSSSAAPAGGAILAADPSDFANCGRIACWRGAVPEHSFDIRGGSLWLHLFLHTTPAGDALGLLSCGPEHDTDDAVVGIPLFEISTASGGQPSEYMRPIGRRAVLISKPAPGIPTKLVRIRVDGGRGLPKVPSRSYWYHIRRSVDDGLELVHVEPVSCSRWHKERSLIEVATDAESDDPQRILTRFRGKAETSDDFIVVLEMHGPGLQGRCHVMVASRDTSLQEIARRFADIRPEALARNSASNRLLSIRVSLDAVAKRQVFILRLATSSTSLAINTTNATLELRYLQRKAEIEWVRQVEEKKIRREGELDIKLEEVGVDLGRAQSALATVKKELASLEERKKLLLGEVESHKQTKDRLNAELKDARRQQERLSEWRLRARRRQDKFLHGKPDGNMEADDEFTEHADQLLHYAAGAGCADLVLLLLIEKGANVAAKSARGWTPLHLAALNGHNDVVLFLLSNGADAKVESNDGETPLDLAVRERRETTVQLLLGGSGDLDGMSKRLGKEDATGTEAITPTVTDKIIEPVSSDPERYRIHLQADDEDVYVCILDKVRTKMASLVEETFRADLDKTITADPSPWTALQTLPDAKHIPILLTRSNTAAAKGIRISGVMALISRSLHRHLFRPVYLLDDDDENLVRFLRLLQGEDAEIEAHMRATLLFMMPERQRELGARRAKTVVREVSRLVQHLLTAPQLEAFVSRLDTVCRFACDQWMYIQQQQLKIEPYFGPPYDDFDWEALRLPEFSETACTDGPTGATEPTLPNKGSVSRDNTITGESDEKSLVSELDPEEILFVVWPTMCSVEDGDLISITQGLVITREQAQPALEEVRLNSH